MAGRARSVVSGVILASALVLALAPSTASASAGDSAAAGSPEKFQATLVVLPDDAGHVEVRRSGKDAFKQADDGIKLNEGDTVRTDDVGHAEIDYSDESYTRLDVNTTFTLVKLVENQGKREVEGSLDVGRTWNRTEALTESESFEQEGGGATAAVAGTAFSMECTQEDQQKLCETLAVLHNVLLTSSDEEVQKLLDELDLCEITEGKLCEDVDPQTIQDMINNAWTQLNLQRDLLERGLGPGPFTDVQAEQEEVPIEVGGVYTPVVVGGEVATAPGAGTATGRLPFTGSSDTPSWVLVGLAVTALGVLFVAASRRRASVLRRR